MPRILKGSSIQSRFAALAAARKSSSPSKSVDTVKAVLDTLGANFEKVGVGDGMAIKVPEGTDAKKYLAGIRGKLVSVGREGQPWAGRKYKTSYDDAAKEVLILRDADGTPLPRKVGGRKPGTKNAPKPTAGASDPKPQTTDESAAKGAEGAKDGADKPAAQTRTTRGQVKDLTGGASPAA